MSVKLITLTVGFYVDEGEWKTTAEEAGLEVRGDWQAMGVGYGNQEGVDIHVLADIHTCPSDKGDIHAC